LNVAHNWADFTGGDHSRASSRSFNMMARAGREAVCTYRVAFKPPERRSTSIHDVVVVAGGVRVPYSYRVQFISRAEQQMRLAQKVMRNPLRNKDLDVTAAIVPVEAGKRRWEANVRVALDISSLNLLPIGGTEAGHLDVAALLEHESTGKSWVLRGGADLTLRTGSSRQGVLVYEKALDRLKPGSYRLRAFVNDRDQDLYGGAEARIVLPDVREEGLIGPLASCPRREVYAASLPLANKDENVGRRVVSKIGAAPFGGGALMRGERLSLDSWICSETDVDPGRNLLRFIEQDGKPLFRLPEGWTEGNGRCRRFTDLLDTIELSPGKYTYRIIWLPAAGVRPVSQTIDFSVKPDPAWLTQAYSTGR
jgi:hypothetical protein